MQSSVWALHCLIFMCLGVGGSRVSSIVDDTHADDREAVNLVRPKSTDAMAIQAVKRACIEDFGNEYENLLLTGLPDLHPNGETRGKLSDLLGQRWALEDAVAVDPRNETLKEELTAVKAMVKERFFSVAYVGQMCDKDMALPREDAIRDCVLGHVENATTVKRAHMIGFRTVSLALTIDQKVQLKELIKRRWSLEKQLRLLGNAAKHLSRSDRNLLKASKAKEYEDAKAMIKTLGFSVKHTTDRCTKEVKRRRDSLGNSAAVMARIASEINGPVAKQNNSCSEIPGDFCPEGTSPDSRRGFDSRTFGAVYAGTFTVYKPAAMGIGFVVGTLVGGPALGAAFAAGAAIPGPGFVVPVPIAAAAATDWFPKCRCFPNDCVFDEHSLSCAMAASGKSSNPFERLPYPGQKCIPVGQPGENGKIECTLQACSAEDYAPGWKDMPIFGSVGTHGKETRNCLSTTGSAEESLLLVDSFVVSNDSSLNNTAGNRSSLYTMLGVEASGIQTQS